jgi:hypothetical protein
MALSVHRARNISCCKRWNEYLAQDARDMAIAEGLGGQQPDDLDSLDNQMGPVGNKADEEERPDEFGPEFDDERTFQYLDDNYDDPPGLEYADAAVGESIIDSDAEANPEIVVDPPAVAPERDYVDLNPAMDDTLGNVEVELYEGAAWVTGRVEAPFSILLRTQLQVGLNNAFYPFAGAKEWELACWMHNSGLSRRQMDAFLRLNYVSTKRNPLLIAG